MLDWFKSAWDWLVSLAAASLRKKQTPDSQGRLNGNYPDGRDPAFELEIHWSALPTMQGRVEGSSDSIDLLDYITGASVPLGTITVHPDSTPGTGWSLLSNRYWTYSGTGVASGTVKFRWTLDSTPSVISDSGTLTYSSIADPLASDTAPPAAPQKLTATESLVNGASAVVFGVDPGCDPTVDGEAPSGLANLRIYEGATEVLTQSAFGTLTPQFTGADIGTVDSSGSVTQGSGSTANEYALVVHGGSAVGSLVTPLGENGVHAYLPITSDSWIFSCRLPAAASITTDATSPVLAIRVTDSLDPQSRGFILFATYPASNSTLRVRTRDTNGGGTSPATAATRPTGDFWVRLVKTPDTITAEYSTDRQTWLTSHSAAFALASTHYLALFASAAATTKSLTATIKDVQIQTGGRITATLTPVTAGSHSYTAKRDDVQGNLSAASASASVIVTAPADTTAPSTPGTPTIATQSDVSATFTWTASTDNIAVRGYVAEYSLSGAGSWTALTEVSTNSAGASGLTASTAYDVRVKAIDTAGNESGYSGTLTFSTDAASNPEDVTRPTTNGDGTCTSSATDRITYSFPASSDDSGVVVGHYIWGGNSAADVSTLLNGGAIFAGLSYTETGLSPGQIRYYRRRAVDGAGNQSFSTNAVMGQAQQSTSTGTLQFDSGFEESGTDWYVGKWRFITNGAGHTDPTADPPSANISSTRAREGSKSIRAAVIPQFGGSQPEPKRYRQEISKSGFQEFLEHSKGYWIGYSIWLDPTTFGVSDPNNYDNVLQQFHQTPFQSNPSVTPSDPGVTINPQVTLHHKGGSKNRELKVAGFTDPYTMPPPGETTDHYATIRRYSNSPFPTGKWIDIIINVRFEYADANNGYFRLWAFPTTTGQYFKATQLTLPAVNTQSLTNGIWMVNDKGKNCWNSIKSATMPYGNGERPSFKSCLYIPQWRLNAPTTTMAGGRIMHFDAFRVQSEENGGTFDLVAPRGTPT